MVSVCMCVRGDECVCEGEMSVCVCVSDVPSG